MRRTPNGARLTFTGAYDSDGVACVETDFEVTMDKDELHKLYEQTAKAVAETGKAVKRVRKVLKERNETTPTDTGNP